METGITCTRCRLTQNSTTSILLYFLSPPPSLSLSLVFYTNFAKLVFHPYHIPCSLSCLSARTHTYSLTQSPLTKHSIYLNIFSLSIYFNVNAINNFPSSSLSPCHSVSVSYYLPIISAVEPTICLHNSAAECNSISNNFRRLR